MKKRDRVLLKLSGKLVERAVLLSELAAAMKDLEAVCFAVVHGGGPAIDRLLEKLKVETRFAAGQRVTDATTLEAAEMVLSGSINKSIVGALNRGGVKAVGISGRDADFLQVSPSQTANGRLGFVGEIRRVRVELLRHLTSAGYVPVVSPISSGPGGQAFNVNADWAAAKIAAAWRCQLLLYFGDVPGVLRDGRPMRRLTTTQALRLIGSGEAARGMIPKLESAVWVLDHAVGRVRILSWKGPQTLSRALCQDDSIGTLIEKTREAKDVASRD